MSTSKLEDECNQAWKLSTLIFHWKELIVEINIQMKSTKVIGNYDKRLMIKLKYTKSNTNGERMENGGLTNVTDSIESRAHSGKEASDWVGRTIKCS